MKRVIYHIKQHLIIYSVLLIIAFLAILFFSLSHSKTKEHHARMEHAVSVDGIVTDCQHKVEENFELIADEWHTVIDHYYIVFVEYECNGKTYTWTYKSETPVPQDQIQMLTVDLNDPEYVFNDGNPGRGLLIFGIIFAILFFIIVLIWAFGAIGIFCTFALGAVGLLVGTVMSAVSGKSSWIWLLIGFVAYSAILFFLFMVCSSIFKYEKTEDDSLK